MSAFTNQTLLDSVCPVPDDFRDLQIFNVPMLHGPTDIYPPKRWIFDRSPDEPFTYVMPAIFLEFALFFLLSQGIYHLFKPLKQLKFVCSMIAGVLLGPSFIGRSQKLRSILMPSQEQIFIRDNISLIGMTLQLFISSVKIDCNKMFNNGNKPLRIGVAAIATPFFVLVILFFKILVQTNAISGRPILLMALNLSVSTSPSLAAAFVELNLLTSELGQLALSSALVNDVIVWLFVATVGILKQMSESFDSVMKLVLAHFVLVVIFLGILRPLMLYIIKRSTPRTPAETTPEAAAPVVVKEVYIVLILVGALIMKVVSEGYCGNPLLGPILFGLIIPAGPPLGSTIVQKAETIVEDLLLPFYYMEVGSELDIFEILSDKTSFQFEAIVICGYVAKTFATFLSSSYCDHTVQDSVILALMMNTNGLLEVMAFKFLRFRRHLSPRFLSLLLISTIIKTGLNTSLLETMYASRTRSKMAAKSLEDNYGRSIHTTKHNSELRILTCIHSTYDIPGIVSLLDVSRPNDLNPVCAYLTHLVQLNGQQSTVVLPHKGHTRICNFNGCHKITSTFKSYSKKLLDERGGVMLQPFTIIAPFTSMHEEINRLADTKFVPLILLPFFKDTTTHDQDTFIKTSLTNLTTKVQANAPCTVGILVDKPDPSLPSTPKAINYRYYRKISILFFGGRDDREALAYGSRISDHPNVKIRVTRITMKDEDPLYTERERMYDNILIQEFKFKTMNDPRHRYHHVVVGGWAQAVEVIRKVTINVDLAVLGYRQGPASTIEKEMDTWIENPELGLIGDMLASPDPRDHFGSTVSVLVLKHYRVYDDHPTKRFSISSFRTKVENALERV